MEQRQKTINYTGRPRLDQLKPPGGRITTNHHARKIN
jgi:hypothetical protein